ncbi:hypothetical protein [Desulfococcus multivorans]|uniref:CBM6 domain-containing protein n=1 Tax=Desulfococcus multivorans DSM 2059 TaxID=1121405 RepID=S7U961_DESML|nr:hypothetical protein [Desulfococcus multivorans]AOY57286.1 putative 65kDa virulence protein [Desulfococcus multivorans]AQU99737.1 hypothetical protein B2D07_02385 [Desulfococcus multivorans]EPR30489.1 hypothetical protein dsmv_0893 [Desulfococcus multivorans DSM 2059]SKA28637.1 hypothetical protein SAMN02745446_03794 [Desulfococcus multivorans DSM 2059]
MSKLCIARNTTRLVVFASFLLAATQVHAIPTTYSISQSGWSSGGTVTGFFSGEDLDHDGYINLANGEVDSYQIEFSGNTLVAAFTHTLADLQYFNYTVGSSGFGPSFPLYSFGSGYSYDADDGLISLHDLSVSTFTPNHALVKPVSDFSNMAIEIEAHIDGRDQLIIKGNTIQWHHLDAAAVGRHLGANSPTIIYATKNGSTTTQMEWLPAWPSPPPDEIRFDAYSSFFNELSPVFPEDGVVWRLTKLFGRGEVKIIEQPSSSNEFSLIVEFDDPFPGSKFYGIRLSPVSDSLDSFFADFDTIDGFSYTDDTFYNTHQPRYASGDWSASGGHSGRGALHVSLGGIDARNVLNGMSGGWSNSFHLDDALDVEVSLDYRLIMTQFDDDECAQVLAKIDDGPVEVLEELCGRGKDTGWQTKTFMQSLMAGDHTITIGGYNNKKTNKKEVADIYFDNVEIR